MTVTCDKCEDLSPRVIDDNNVKDPKLIIIGDAPRKDDDAEGKPFAGTAGRFLSGALRRCGLSRGDVYITNVVRCRPPGDRSPTPDEINRCVDSFLLPVLQELPCSTIVTIGDTATKILTGTKSNITKVRGTPLSCTIDKRFNVIPTIHPSYIMRGNMHFFQVFAKDIKRALDWETGELDFDVGVDYILDWRSKHGELYIRELKKRGYSADIETTGLDPHDGTILGIAFSHTPHTGIYFDLSKHGGGILSTGDDGETTAAVQDLLTAPCSKTFQFGQFDTYFLRTHGFDVEGWDFDTKYAQKLIAPEFPSSLSFLSSIYTTYPYYKAYGEKEIRKNIAAVPKKVIAEYCVRDADVTEIVARSLRSELDELGMTDLINDITMPLAHACVNMRLRGMRLDLKALERWEVEVGPTVKSLRAWFDERDVNPNSPKQLGSFLVEKHKLPLRKNKNGNYITDSTTLRKLHNKFDLPVLKYLLEYREHSKIHSTYVRAIDKRRHGDRLYSELVVGGTDTGRLSSRDPNLQNVPKDLRNIFIPEPGELLIDADYKQLEMHVLAVLSGDEQLMYDLTHDVYIPTEIGKSMGWSEEKSVEHKRILKAVMYGTLYGRGARAISIEFGITTKEAATIQSGFLQRYPNVNQYLEGERKTAATTKCIITPFQRRRHFVGDRAATQALNYKIQSCAADVMSTAIIALERELPGMMKLSVHDSAVLSVPESQLRDSVTLMKSILERPIPEMNGFEFPATIEVGENWRDVHEYNR